MIQEDKELLLRDLCARLPYGLMCDRGGRARKLLSVSPDKKYCIELANGEYMPNEYRITDVKPYLRHMSDMTEEEETYYNTVYTMLKFYEKENWLNAHHFDYRGMIEKGLALKAKEGMYEL